MRLLAGVLSCVLLLSDINAITIAKDGAPKCVIHLAADATAPEKNAAKELQDYLKQITGATFEIKSEVAPEAPSIEIGATFATRQLAPDIHWRDLGPDTIVIRADDRHLILAGDRPRGTLYAVYTFLEDNLGVRWWTRTESFLPTHPSLDIAKLVHEYSPRFQYRETYHRDILDLDGPGTAAVRFRMNGHASPIPEEWGGHYNIIGWCHTSYPLLPPEKYFKDHPEYYSLQKGERNPDHGQLCWTNAEMRKELAAQALKWIKREPSAGIISISQNDWQGFCECDACKSIDDANGGAHSASLLVGVNAVADMIHQEYPHFLVETLAYQYTRKPPTQIKPADNVLVRLCSIECDFSHPLSGKSNRSFGDDLRGWSKISKNLFVWNYVTNFSNYLIPHPNYRPLAEDLRFFADHHVVGVFEQADTFNELAGDLLPLRAWVQAHLLWDPSLDQNHLTDEFLQGYYGAAAPMLKEYLTLVNSSADDPKFKRRCYHREADFLSDESLKKCEALFDQAENATRNDAKALIRIQREKLVIEHVALRRELTKIAIDTRDDYQKRVIDFCRRAKLAGVSHFDEGEPFDAYAKDWLAKINAH